MRNKGVLLILQKCISNISSLLPVMYVSCNFGLSVLLSLGKPSMDGDVGLFVNELTWVRTLITSIFPKNDSLSLISNPRLTKTMVFLDTVVYRSFD